MEHRFNDILQRRDKLATQLSDPSLATNVNKFTELSREYAKLEPVVEAIEKLRAIQDELNDCQSLLEEDDQEMRDLAQEDITRLKPELEAAHEALTLTLLPTDPNDARNIILEIRAGTGGDEAALFAADLFRMYCRYAEQHKFKIDVMSSNYTGIGGLKEVVAEIKGKGAYSRFKFESGVHRVQRVPATETSGRIHTSACTVAVLPEAEDVDVSISAEELRIDVFRASGPGGQSVNTTDSAVRITHIASGLVVICQDEKSQHKNKAKAMKVLQARLYDAVQREAMAERADMRRDMVGSGDRSERIRTYNFPQGRVTDHRINLTLYQLDAILMGGMDTLLDALATHDQAERLAAAAQ
ncbi:MAG: peptide chain release factor 1 [Mariprofundales bacterium]